MLRALLSRIRGTFRRRRLDDEFDREIQDHLDMLAQQFMRHGMEPAEACYAARRQFGGVTQMKEELRDRRALPPLDVLAQDVRHAFRHLRKAKWFTASAALTLALGIGAGATVFAVFDTVVLRPLPFADPGRLMAFRPIDRRGTPHPTILSYPNFFDFRAQNRVFERLVSYRDERFTLTDSLPATQVFGEIVSSDLFPLLGVRPQLGRGFLPEEEKPGIDVVVLSDALWKTRFASDPGILGRRVRINGKLFTVVGVAPAGFQFPLDTPPVQLWTTLSQDATRTEFTPLAEQRGARALETIGRLKPGVTPGQAQAQMDQIASALARQYPDDDKNFAKTSVAPELDRLTASSRKPLWILLGAVALVLLIACANVANLLLARSIERAREFVLRTALGASRTALVRQMLAESFLLGLLGSAGGVLLTVLAIKSLLPLAGDKIPVPRFSQVGLDSRVLAFSIVAALLTTVLFSLAPIAQLLRADLTGALKEGAPNIARGHHRLRSTLVVGQVTFGLVLLVGAELLIASFLYMLRRDPGFRPDHLLTFDIGLADARYNAAAQISFSDRLLDRLRAIPGVQAAATGTPLPLAGHEMTIGFDIEERPAPITERPISDMAIVTPGYFNAMGIPLINGRDFSDRDDANAPRVVVVNQAFAAQYFPEEDVIGKRIEPGAANANGGPRTRAIVGVVGNAKQVSRTAEPDPIYYFPYKQLPWAIGSIVLRTTVPPREIEPAARAALMSLDRETPMFEVRTGDELSAAAITVPRFLMVLMGSFAAIALLLTVIGLYGVLSYAVARRRREIGVRIALGAGHREVLTLVLKQAMQLVMAGLMLGLAGAAGAQRLLQSISFGIRPGDPIFLTLACGVMLVASLLAAYLPAMRAVSVDPMQALRSE